jgi:PD-(D/E)XK nuclease superfamily
MDKVMHRRTVVVQGPLAFHVQRLAAADQGAIGLQLTTLPQLAARLAGGFFRPANSEDVESSLQDALRLGGFDELEPVASLPGITRAAIRTLKKVWDADVCLAALEGIRLSDLALLEKRVRDGLPRDAFLPKDLSDRALGRIHHAACVVGEVELDRLMDVPQVWRPLVQALCKLITVRWRDPGTDDLEWFKGEVIRTASPATPAPRIFTCASPRAEVMESLRWARQLLSSGTAQGHEIAICAASTDEWDDHMLTLAKSAGFPIHFSNGLPALSTGEGQACAALADLLINGLSQDRVRRLFGHSIGKSRRLKDLSYTWALGLRSEAGLFQFEHWQWALREAAAQRPDHESQILLIEGALEMLTSGIAAAEEAGEELLAPNASLLWKRALKSAPAAALILSLKAMRWADDSEAGASIVWCPAMHLVGAPRPFVWLMGLTSGTWPQRSREDPLLPDHVLSHRVLDPIPIAAQQRRAFELIRTRASGGCMMSRSRRGGQGGALPASPLLALYSEPTLLRRERIPQHAFSETDRLLARPEDVELSPRLRLALSCWSAWGRSELSAHDGRVRKEHPVIRRAIERVQSATSLARLLRDPLGFVWRYALGWQAPEMIDEPLSIDARSWGELVHELLRRVVNNLEPSPGFTRATNEALREALRSAIAVVREEWPLSRPVPPLLLWEHTLLHAEDLTFKALTRDTTFHPGTQCWTEVAFGSGTAGRDGGPWSEAAEVTIPGTAVRIRGAIDRLDRNATGSSIRVTDYKTGAEPPNAERVVISGGASLQRVIYAAAVMHLLPQTQRVVARLFYLGDNDPQAYELADVERAVREVGRYVAQAYALLDDGNCLPGLVREEFDDYRIALPAGLESYLGRKRGPVRKVFGDFTRIWSMP